MNRILLAALVAGTLILPTPAFAHAKLVSSAPAEGATVASPETLELTFNEMLNPAFSTLKLLATSGAVIETGAPSLIADDKGMAITVPQALEPGDYTAEWSVLSSDGHKLSGSYSFTVSP